MAEWEAGLDGRPKAPWTHQKVVYLLDPATGSFLTFMNSTVGTRIAWETLRERVITMRALRGARVLPLVRLGHRPMKTSFGMKHRPEFEIVGWKRPGDDGDAIGGPSTPQLAGPTAATPPAAAKPVDEAAKTLSALGEVSPPSLSEEMGGDRVPW